MCKCRWIYRHPIADDILLSQHKNNPGMAIEVTIDSIIKGPLYIHRMSALTVCLESMIWYLRPNAARLVVLAMNSYISQNTCCFLHWQCVPIFPQIPISPPNICCFLCWQYIHISAQIPTVFYVCAVHSYLCPNTCCFLCWQCISLLS